jgi:hypothetical protein
VQCKVTTDCPASSYCAGVTCVADVCDATMSTCAGNGVAACNDTGSGWATAKSCGAQGCQATGGVASCGGEPVDGGPPQDDGGQPPGDTSISCTTETTNPCSNLPKFGGSQELDGKGDDLCSIPSFTFGFANAQVKNNYNSIPESQFEVVTGRVGWSADGIHAFFDVQDASVQTANMKDPGAAIDRAYQGDSIELYISSSDTLSGLTANDNNALHLIVPANGPAVIAKASSGGGATHTALAEGQYKQATTSAGYAIELKLPWPGGAPSGGSKVRFDLALNSADTNCSGVDDMRDAQLILFLGTPSPTTCPGGVDAYCDDRAWCSTTLQE